MRASYHVKPHPVVAVLQPRLFLIHYNLSRSDQTSASMLASQNKYGGRGGLSIAKNGGMCSFGQWSYLPIVRVLWATFIPNLNNNKRKTSGDECDFDNRLPSGVKALVDERRWSFAEFISRGALSGSIYQGIEQTNNNDDTSITS